MDLRIRSVNVSLMDVSIAIVVSFSVSDISIPSNGVVCSAGPSNGAASGTEGSFFPSSKASLTMSSDAVLLRRGCTISICHGGTKRVNILYMCFEVAYYRIIVSTAMSFEELQFHN